MNTAMTIREACMQASSFLKQHSERRVTESGLEAPLLGESSMDSGTNSESNAVQLDYNFIARALLIHVLRISLSELLLRWNEPFPHEYGEEWQAVLQRKASGEPVQYIVGEQEFYGLEFEVNRNVLIPRPETELLVEAILKHGSKLWPQGAEPLGASEAVGAIGGVLGGVGKSVEASEYRRGPVLVDIGTGSGAIAVTCAVKQPSWQVIAADISTGALEVAKRNALRNGVLERMHFVHGDLLQPMIANAQMIDILVSNPPYIESDDIQGLQTEVRDFEPMSALDGGKDGLDFYRRILSELSELPQYPRLMGFEVGQGQAPIVAELMREVGKWAHIEIIRDLAGIERHVIGVQEVQVV